MKNISRIATIALAVATVVAAQAKETWQIQGTTYSVDTISHIAVGPGTTLTVLDMQGSSRQRVFYTVTDLTNPNVEIKTICGKDELRTNQTIPTMVASHNDTENVYFAGVNSDLFSQYGPIGTTVVDGELYKIPRAGTSWYAVGYDKEDNGLHFGACALTMVLRGPNNLQASPALVNIPREESDFIVYTERWGETTGTDNTGIEVLLKLTSGPFQATGANTATVVGAPVENVGNMAIPKGHIVISVTRAYYKKTIQKFKDGDEITITPSMSIDNGAWAGTYAFKQLTEMSGGNPLLVRDGEVLNTETALDHLVIRRPRTALGVDASGKKMVLMVVDGDKLNAGVSDGCTSKETAEIMVKLGCHNVINFDGGGSSTMYTSMLGVWNVPSDGGLRKVRNGWFVTTPNTGDNQVTSIAFADFRKDLTPGESFSPVVYGYNAAGLLVDTDVKGVTLTCDAAGLGISNGKVTANALGRYALKAQVGDKTATLRVIVDDGSGISDVAVVKTALLAGAVKKGTAAQLVLGQDSPIAVYDMTGRCIQRLNGHRNETIEISTDNKPCGIYLVRTADTTMKLTIN